VLETIEPNANARVGLAVEINLQLLDAGLDIRAFTLADNGDVVRVTDGRRGVKDSNIDRPRAFAGWGGNEAPLRARDDLLRVPAGFADQKFEKRLCRIDFFGACRDDSPRHLVDGVLGFGLWSGHKLNKGESRNALAKAVFFNRLGELRDRTHENQRHRASGLNLVVAAIVLWNTVYLERAVAALRERGQTIPDELLAHLSPLKWEHINLTGDYHWRPDGGLGNRKLRPLRAAPAPLELTP
jgi:hypothetical protein